MSAKQGMNPFIAEQLNECAQIILTSNLYFKLHLNDISFQPQNNLSVHINKYFLLICFLYVVLI